MSDTHRAAGTPLVKCQREERSPTCYGPPSGKQHRARNLIGGNTLVRCLMSAQKTITLCACLTRRFALHLHQGRISMTPASIDKELVKTIEHMSIILFERRPPNPAPPRATRRYQCAPTGGLAVP